MAVHFAPGLTARIVAFVVRAAGSDASLVFYDGTMPEDTDASADGTKFTGRFADEQIVRALAAGTEPEIPKGATYWRLFDNGGLVLMQGDGKS